MSGKTTATGVVSVDARTRKAKILYWAVRVLLVLALVAGVAGAVWYFMPDKHKNDTPSKDAAIESIQSTTTTVDTLKYAGRTSSAVQEAQKALDAAKTPQEQAYYNMQIGTIYESEKDYAKALEYYRKAEGYKQAEIHTESAIARCAEALGDKATALDYYRRAYNAVDTSRMGYEAKQSAFKSKIEELGGSL